jgi:hypothetical protein
MFKQNQYYRLIEHDEKKKIAKVFNFRTNQVEVYLTVLTKEEKLLQRKRRQDRLPKDTYGIVNKNPGVNLLEPEPSKEIIFIYKLVSYYSNLYLKYSQGSLCKNKLICSIILRRYMKSIQDSRYGASICQNFYNVIYKKELKRSFVKYNTFVGSNLNIISVYIILRRTNIYVTIVKDGKIARIFSPCLFRHIPKKGKKKSMSFFYTVKRTIMFITRFFFNKQKKYFLKIFFKGFQKFRRPLLSRFFFNKRIKSRCIGIYNIDFEPFNGCRLRKSKRIQIRGQRKQAKRFSL